MHHQPGHAAVHALDDLRRLHNVAWISADDAIAEAYGVLEQFDAVDEFSTWSEANEGRTGYWPHLAAT